MVRAVFCPPWQRAVIVLSSTTVAVLLTAMFYWGRAILIPLAVAVFLAFVLSPVVRALRRIGVPNSIAAIATSFTAAILSISLVWMLTQQIASLTMTLPDHKERIVRKVAALKAWTTGGDAQRLGTLIDEIEATLNTKKKPTEEEGATPVVTEAKTAGWSGWVDRYVSPAAEGLGQSSFAVVLVLFFLLKRENLRDRFIRLIGDGQVTTTTKALNDASTRVSRFLFKQFLFNLAFGTVIAIGLLVIGVQYALLWGAIASVMRYLPYIGTWLGVIPPTVYTLAMTDAWWPPVVVLVLILGLELISNNLIEPFLYGKSLGVSEVAQLIAAGFWSFLWGPIGLILSGPLTTCLLVLGKHVPALKFLDILLGDEPPLDQGVMFFQRLTARDDDAAAHTLAESISNSGIAATVDGVIVPALQLLKHAEHEAELSPAAVTSCLAIIRELAEEFPQQLATIEKNETLPRLIIVPAQDDVDAMACDLLARLLPAEKWNVTVVAASTLTGEFVEQIEALSPDLVVIGSVPPGGIAHSRYMVKRIQTRHPNLTLIMGRWSTDESSREDDPAKSNVSIYTIHTIQETIVHIMGWRPAKSELEKHQSESDKHFEPLTPTSRMITTTNLVSA